MSVPIRVPLSFGDEKSRVDALRRYRILDTAPEPEFDRITRLAARLFSVPEARIVFLDGDRVWIKSHSGGVRRQNRDALHWDTILSDGALVSNEETGFFAGVPVKAREGYRIGVLSVLDDRPRPDFGADQESALAELAQLVAQQLDDRVSEFRVRESEAERARTHSELQARVLQQAAVSHLGQRALAGAGLDELMKEAVDLVAQTLQVEFAKLLELLPNGRRMLLRAGIGWRPGIVGRLVVSARTGSQGAYSLKSSEPVIVEDLNTETRFRPPRLLRQHGVVSGITVIILGREQPFGVIGAHTSKRRSFTVDDINFLQSIANTLSAAIERKRAESALARSEGTVRALLEAVPQAVLASGASGRITFVNARTEQMFGYTREELLGLTIETLMPDRFRRAHHLHRSGYFADPRFRAMGQGLDLYALRKDGTEFPVEIDLGYVDTTDGTLAISLVTDITARKEAEEQIVFQASLLSQVRNAVIATDSAARIVYWNEFARSIYGWTPQEAIGRNVVALIVPPESAEQQQIINAGLAGSGHWEGEFVLSRKDGSRFPAFITASALKDKTGRISGVVGVSVDMSERKQAEEALRQAKRNLETVVETTPLAVISVDLEGCVRFWNPAAERMFGWSEAEVLGKPVPTVPEDEASHFRNLMDGHRAGQGVSGVERRRKRKDGSLIDVTIWTSPLRSATGEIDGALGVFVDITERRRFEEQIRQSETLDAVCRLVEAQSGGVLCSVLLVDETGLLLRNGGAPSLPKSYVSAIDGVPIGPHIGCCGAATFAGEVVVADDVVSDPRWEKFRHLALEHGLRACWSAPVFSGAKRVMGAFAMYAREPRAPSAQELELLQRAARLAASVIERNAAEQALREKEEKYRTLFEENRDAIIVTNRQGRVVDANQAALDLFGYGNDEAELLGRHDVYVDPRDRVRFQLALDANGSVRDFEARLRRRDGAEIDCLITATVRRAKSGNALGYQAILRDVTARKEAERSLLELSGRLLQMQDEERRRIARELHDSTAQSLAALAMNISLLEIEMPDGMGERAHKLLSESRALAGQCSRELRTISHLLHPPLLDELGLASALRSYIDGFASRSGIRTDLEIGAELPRLPRDTETALFRIVQESLTNVHRHSASETAQIRLLADSGEVRVEVSDQGRGLPGGTIGHGPGDSVWRLGVGIRGMRERLRQLGGRLEIDSGPGGTTVRAVLPLMAADGR